MITPGNWAVFETGDGLTINTAEESYDPPIAYVHTRDDALVIAAAKDLKDALRGLLDQVERGGHVATGRAVRALLKSEGKDQ
jgi:hypothetical protein